MGKKTKLRRTLVMLTLNEIEGLQAIFPLIPRDKVSEFFAVDGGSTDGTIEFYKKHKVRVLGQKSKGRGEAFRIAMKEAKNDNVVFFSPDGNEDPRDIPRLFERLESGKDMVIASRFMKGARCDEEDQFIKVRKFGNVMFTTIINILFNGRLTDSINGFRGITKAAFRRISPDARGFGIEFQLSIRAMKLRLDIAELPTQENDRIGGQSTAGTWGTGWYFIRIIIREFFKRSRRVAFQKK